MASDTWTSGNELLLLFGTHAACTHGTTSKGSFPHIVAIDAVTVTQHMHCTSRVFTVVTHVTILARSRQIVILVLL